MKPLSQINVIPFIDIMLVLLAIVLLTATFVAQGKIPITIPQASSSDAMAATPTLELTIDDSGRVFIDGMESNIESLAAQLSQMPSDTPVLLRVDGHTSFEHFVSVIDRLKARNMQNLSILTRTPTG